MMEYKVMPNSTAIAWLLVMGSLSGSAWASQDLNTALGGGAAGVAGSIIGKQFGGQTGALAGAAIGGAVGGAATTRHGKRNEAALGGAIGALSGAAIGQQVGGDNGQLIGAGIGGAAGGVLGGIPVADRVTVLATKRMRSMAVRTIMVGMATTDLMTTGAR